MNPLEIFAISFAGSFAGTLVVFIANYILYKKQDKKQESRFTKLKKSVQTTVRNVGKRKKK